MNKPLLVSLVGPTASGKTEVSLRVARDLPLVIISSDSRQVFQHLDIGTAKPTPEQQQKVEHRCIDIVHPSDPYSAGRYGEDALAEVQNVLGQGTLPMVVGGSGLYVKALVEGLTHLPEKDDEIRRILEERLDEEGEEVLRKELREVDPESERSIEPGKPRRIVRALEVYYLTGRPLSVHHAEQLPERPFTPLTFYLSVPRDELYARINARAIDMVGRGLVGEVEKVLAMGVPPTAQALNTVGYNEALQFIEGEITESTMVELMQQMTRRFAKRQVTWFRGEHSLQWIDAPDSRPMDAIAAEILDRIAEFQKN